MRRPDYMAHQGLEVAHFPVHQRLVRKSNEWVMGPVIQCPVEGCCWTLGLAKELLQVLGDAASEHLEDEQQKHKALCRDLWQVHLNNEERWLANERKMTDPIPGLAPPYCECGKESVV